MKGVTIPLLLTADLANVDSGGKLNVIGVFGNLLPLELPYKHQSMYLVLVLRFHPTETGKKCKLKVELIDEDGIEVFAIPEMEFDVPKALDPAMEVEFPLVAQIGDLEVQKEGVHKWVVLMDGDHKAELRMTVKKRIVT